MSRARLATNMSTAVQETSGAPLSPPILSALVATNETPLEETVETFRHTFDPQKQRART